jgi:hypothetical protein
MTRFNSPAATVATLVPPCRRSPQRITITVTWQTHQQLQQRSDYEGRSLSNLAAHLLERGVAAT